MREEETANEIVKRNGLCVLLLLLQAPSADAHRQAMDAMCKLAENNNAMKTAITQSTIMGSLFTLCRTKVIVLVLSLWCVTLYSLWKQNKLR